MIDLEFVGDYRQPRLSPRERELGPDVDGGDFTFGDLLDIINPLQHIPVIATLYREITGDEISPHARIVGDTLFGGPMGFVSSVANVFYEEVAGEDIGETVLALFGGGEEAGDPQFAGAEDAVAPADGPLEPLPAPLESAAGPIAAEPKKEGAADPDHGVPAPDVLTAAAGEANAVLPEPAPGVLTGQDAMNALFRDLTGSRQQQAATPPAKDRPDPLPLPGRAGEGGKDMKSYPLPPRPAHVPHQTAPAQAAVPAEASSHPLLVAQESADAAIADRMMQALDKYQAMARKNRQEREQAADEPLRWQGDPTAGGS